MKRLLTLFFIFLATNSYAFDFKNWQVLIERHVSPGAIHGISLNVVDYATIGKDPDYKVLLEELKNFSPAALTSEEEKKSFWINVYNILAVKVIVENYPVKSIRDVGSLFKPVWKRDAGVVGGEIYTLDHIEHGILRPMGDPRIHSAIVCASVSCPDLSPKVFRPETLSDQLDESLKNFLENDKKGLAVDPENKILYLSSIFDWFKEDFEKSGGTVEKFISKYLTPEKVQFIEAGGYKIKYFDYDWYLNTKSPT